MTQHRPAPSLRELGYFTEDEYLALRGVGREHARNERSRGDGPPFTKMGKTVVYPVEGVRAWLAARTVQRAAVPTLANSRSRRGRPSGEAA